MDRFEEQRGAFEEASYEKYLTSETEARVKFPKEKFRESMKPAQFLKRDNNGKYVLLGLDAAWWGWQAHNQMMFRDKRCIPEPILILCDAVDDIIKEALTYLIPSNPPEGSDDTLINAVIGIVDNAIIVDALTKLGRL